MLLRVNLKKQLLIYKGYVILRIPVPYSQGFSDIFRVYCKKYTCILIKSPQIIYELQKGLNRLFSDLQYKNSVCDYEFM